MLMRCTADFAAPPAESLADAYELRDEMLALIEAELGPRDASYALAPFEFRPDGPYIEFPASLTAGIVLSPGAARYWPTFIYETAHELVHLLNPVPFETTWFEEAVAMDVQLRLTPLLCGIDIPGYGPWQHALEILRRTFESPAVEARRVREHCGAFANVTAEQLTALYPSANVADLAQLGSVFPRTLETNNNPTLLNTVLA
jgi:hypothetical protein